VHTNDGSPGDGAPDTTFQMVAPCSGHEWFQEICSHLRCGVMRCAQYQRLLQLRVRLQAAMKSALGMYIGLTKAGMRYTGFESFKGPSCRTHAALSGA